MYRIVIMTLAVVFSGLSLSGCGSSEPPKRDAPVITTTKQPTKGNKRGAPEMSLEDPLAKKK